MLISTHLKNEGEIAFPSFQKGQISHAFHFNFFVEVDMENADIPCEIVFYIALKIENSTYFDFYNIIESYNEDIYSTHNENIYSPYKIFKFVRHISSAEKELEIRTSDMYVIGNNFQEPDLKINFTAITIIDLDSFLNTLGGHYADKDFIRAKFSKQITKQV